MIVSALLATAVVYGAPAPVLRPEGCPAQGKVYASRPPAPNAHGAQTLASLPPADMHLLVIRSVGGCAVATVVREKIQGDGRFAKSGR